CLLSFFFFFSSRRRHTRSYGDWSSDVCSSDLLASACVAVAGSILFIGLIAPHMARRLVGTRHAVLLPAAAAIGTLMLLVADAIGRGAHPPIEMPAGMVTALIGAPYFVYLLTSSL